jgi:hypothetical protein
MADVVPFKKPQRTRPPKPPKPRSLAKQPRLVKPSAAQFAGQCPTPQRITLALDYRQLYGPEVDKACGVEEPTVDLWETGEVVPTFEQIEALGALTQFPVAFFYRPAPEPLGRVFMCGEGGSSIYECTDSCPHCGGSLNG